MTPPRHPQADELLQYLDGELKSRAAARIRAHLETCWQCRAELQELQNTVSDLVRYRKNVLQCHLPPPPAPWMDIQRQFAEMDASTEPAFFSRVVRLLQWPARSAARWAPVALALLVLGFLLYQDRKTPPVHAAELLRKAVAASEAHPGRPHPIQIRTRTHRFTRLPGENRRTVSNAADAKELESIHAMFVAANYDWENPLSAKAYASWRDQLPTKTDEVEEKSDAFRVRTSTSSGELQEATLTLSNPDLRPVYEKFEFRDQEWVEITELAEDFTLPEIAAAPSEARIPARAEAVPAPDAEPSLPSISEPAATIGDELHVWAALHGIGADLGDPIEVSLSGGKVQVTGAGIPSQRRQEIQSALASQTNVVVKFSDAPLANAVPPARAPAATAPSDPDARQFQKRITEQAGGRASFEQLTGQVLDLSEPMMAQMYALRRLAEQFPAQSETQLSPLDRQILRHLRDQHVAELRQRARGLDRTLRPFLVSLAGTVRPAPLAAPATVGWQAATEDLFQSARRVDKLVAVMFGSAPGDSTVDQTPAQLLSSLAQLQARLESYGRNDQ